MKLKKLLLTTVALVCLTCTLPIVSASDANELKTISEKYSSIFEKSSGDVINLRKATTEDLKELNEVGLVQSLGYGAETLNTDELFSLDNETLWLVIENKDKNIAGQIILSKGSDEKSVNIGYFVSEKFRGKGYATLASINVIKKIWELDKTAKFEFWIEDKNITSIKVLKKICKNFDIDFENPTVLKSNYQMEKEHSHTVEILAIQSSENPKEYNVKYLFNGFLNNSSITSISELLENYSLEKINSGTLLSVSTTKYLIKYNPDENKTKESELLYSKIHEFLEQHKDVSPEDFEKVCCDYIANNSGSPILLEKEDFVKNSAEKTVLYRGISEKKYANDFRNGKIYVGKNVDNVRGNGIYTTSNIELAESFANNNGAVVEMFFTNDKDLKIIETPYLKEIRQIMCQSHPEEFEEINNNNKPDLMFDPLGTYLYEKMKDCITEDTTIEEYELILKKIDQDPLVQQLKESRVKYFKDKKASIFHNLGLLAKLMGYNVLYTDAYDFDFKGKDTNVKEYLILDSRVLTICK